MMMSKSIRTRILSKIALAPVQPVIHITNIARNNFMREWWEYVDEYAD